MKGTPQPALLYLVPFTLIPSIIIAILRKELRQLWNGPENHIQKSADPQPINTTTDDNLEDNLLINDNQIQVK